MSYGVLLKNASSGFIADDLTFYGSQRAGISTSDPLYFSLIGFNSCDSMNINYAQFGSLISNTSSSTFSNVNFDLNQNQFYGLCLNLSKPTIIKLCDIQAFEIGVGQTVFTNNFVNDSKYILNLTNPGNIYVKTSSYPTGVQTSIFGTALNYTWPISINLQNFIYVEYSDTNFTKYFLAVPQVQGAQIPNNFFWYEIPTTKFFYNVDFSIILTTQFNGSSLALNNFNGIIPKVGQSILIDNSLNNDSLSGVYTILSITNQINLGKSEIEYNFPSQTFIVEVDLSFSNSLNYIPGVFYVPFEYGYPALCFSKNLMLKKYENIAQNSPSNYVPLLRDNFDSSSLCLRLNDQAKYTKQSDTFILGIAVSNWYPDSTLFGLGLNYMIKEGF